MSTKSQSLTAELHSALNQKAGHVRGTIKLQFTSAIKFKAYAVRASNAKPQYLITLDTSDHLRSALTMLKSKS